MASGTTSLTQEELDYLTQSVLSKKIAEQGVTQIDQIGCPSVDFVMGKSKELGAPVNDGYRFYVSGRRGQRIQWWDGADLLTFENRHTIADMQFDVGRGHMGYELLYQFLEKHGIRIDYKKGLREKGAAPGKVLEVAVKVIEHHLEGVMYDWKIDFARRFWRANTDQTKCFAGFDALCPASTNSTGTIGGRSRSNPMFRHQLVTGLSKSNFMKNFFDLVKLAGRKGQKGKINYWACGDDIWGILVDLFSGTDTVAGKFDYRTTQDKAMAMGEKYNVALPQNCFMYEGAMIVNDPLFAELDNEEPSASPTWGKRIVGLNTNHFGIVPVMDMEKVSHGMPYNQRLERWSLHGEYVEWCNHPGTIAIGVAA